MSTPQLRIAIVGAGPAGLTLGVLLQKQQIPFVIFELRQKPTEKELLGLAGSLDLHESSGLAALEACGLREEFTTYTGDCSEAQKIAGKDGLVIYSDQGEAADRPEISRNKLNKLLLSHISPSLIRWGHRLYSCKKSTHQTRPEVELDFGEHGTHNFDLVIGADGAWSKIRNYLTDAKPHYAGIHNITLNIRHISTRHPQLAELVGRGSFAALADHYMVASQRSVDDSARIYIMISTSDEHLATTSGLAGASPVKAKSILLNNDDSLFRQWGTSIRNLIAVACDDEFASDPEQKLDIKALHSLPPGHRWEHRAGATLIGDAAHRINPPAGEGVNIAMLDSLLLSQAIVKAYKVAETDQSLLSTALDSLVKDFEADMSARAKEMAHESLSASKMMFGSNDGASVMAAWFNEASAAAAAAAQT